MSLTSVPDCHLTTYKPGASGISFRSKTMRLFLEKDWAKTLRPSISYTVIRDTSRVTEGTTLRFEEVDREYGFGYIAIDNSVGKGVLSESVETFQSNSIFSPASVTAKPVIFMTACWSMRASSWLPRGSSFPSSNTERRLNTPLSWSKYEDVLWPVFDASKGGAPGNVSINVSIRVSILIW